jgi:hypothetical protein
LLQRWIAKRRWTLFFLMAWTLGTLSLIQVMLFSTSLGASLVILAAQPLFEKKGWLRSIQETVLLLAIAVTMAFLVGGMFNHSDWYAKGLFVFHWPPGYLKYATQAGVMELNFVQAFLWYLSTFGSLTLIGLPVILWGLLSLRKDYHPLTLFFVSFSVASFVMPHFFHYRASWDIIKWFTGFQIATAFLAIWLIQRLKSLSPKFICLLIPLLFMDILPSLRFLEGLAFGDPAQFKGRQRNWLPAVIHEPTPSVAYFVDKLRYHPWKELVFAPPEVSSTLAHYSGQAMATVDHNTLTFGPKPELVQTRYNFLNEIKKNFSPLLLQQSKIVWILFPCDKFAKDFSAESAEAVQTALDNGSLNEISVPQEFGCWKFYRLVTSPTQ